jgi:hypothetical protein
MAKWLLPMVVLLLAEAPAFQPDCRCRKANAEEVTRWGWISYLEEKEYKVNKIRGQVLLQDRDTPIKDGLVEVLDNPALAFRPENIGKKVKQKRLTACITGEKGEFCFEKLPPGKYELKFSLHAFDTLSVLVIVIRRRERRSDEQVLVNLHLSN